MEQEINYKCETCGSAIHRDIVRAAFWEGEKLVVVEDIPALVCEGCMEQYYDDETVFKIDMLRGNGFPSEKARREIRVPVFSLKDHWKKD